MNIRPVPLSFVFMLASVFAMSPLAIDLYLPTIPRIADDFNSPVQQLAITLSLYVFGLSLGQFIGGPLSDYWGRRRVLFIGLLVFVSSSLVLAFAQSLEVFWGARVIQALGGGFAAVVVPALIRDNTEGRATAKLFSLIGLITIFAPAVAPSLGTLIFSIAGWRAIFVALALYASVIGVITWRFLHSPSIVSPSPAQAPHESLLQRYRYVLSNGLAMRYLLAQGFSFSVMMNFLVNSSVVYIEKYQQSEAAFSILFASNIIALAAANRLNAYLLNTVSPARILMWSVSLQTAACTVLLVATPFSPPLWLVVAMVVISIGCMGGVMGNTQACCLHFFPRHSGIASALQGSAQYLIGALLSAASTLFVSEKIWPLSVSMAACALLALWALPRPNRFEQAAS